MIARALTIAGSDSCGGAGVEMDLKVFAALGVYGACAITAVTAQNSRGVISAFELPADLVAQQIDAVLGDVGADAIKTGMLSSAAIAEVIAQRLAVHGARNLVVDPVIAAKDGTRLLTEHGVAAVREKLLPLAALVTPNAPEAEALTGEAVSGREGMVRAARELVDMGAKAALVKGGHLPGTAVDVLWDGSEQTVLENPRLPGPPVHGTGCVLAAAIAGYLARGERLADAVAKGREFLQRALADTFSMGGEFRLFAPFAGRECNAPDPPGAVSPGHASHPPSDLSPGNGAQPPSAVSPASGLLVKPAKSSYRRSLPHLPREGKAFFVTFATHQRWQLPECARATVLKHCLRDHGTKLMVHGVVVMPDHVHMVFTPLRDENGNVFGLAEIMRGIKGASARHINRLLDRSGKVWQEEYFDRILRSNESAHRKVEYICDNPLRKGLVEGADDYPWLWREWVEGQE
jgi:hydroxymethylpyrimidine/phosphomethylpyrimidine kinase